VTWSLGLYVTKKSRKYTSEKTYLFVSEAQGKKATVAAWERVAMGMGEIFCLPSGVPWG
jgi:hypothetical protein